MSFLLVALLLMCREGIHSKPINPLIGPFIVYAEHYYSCEPKNHPLPWKIQVRTTHFNPYKPKELQLMTGKMTANATFDDSCWLRGIMDVWSSNQWKENAFIFYFKTNGCKSFKENIPGIYDLFFKKRETKGACKINPGVYEVTNAPINWTFPNVPILPYGHFRFRLSIGKAKDLYVCEVVECDIIPKSE